MILLANYLERKTMKSISLKSNHHDGLVEACIPRPQAILPTINPIP
jgi:hypothetical protein